MKAKFTALSAALALFAGAATLIPLLPTSQVEAQRGRGTSWATRNYVMKAGASDLYEIRSSELAASRARRSGIREFAQMLVRDHQRTTALVTQSAREDGVPVRPPMLEPAQRNMIRQLERARPADFDRLYLSQQVMAHQQALSLHRGYSQTGDARALRRTAAGAVPIILGHLQHARRLQRMR